MEAKVIVLVAVAVDQVLHHQGVQVVIKFLVQVQRALLEVVAVVVDLLNLVQQAVLVVTVAQVE
jgi:hypothetical protein